MDSFPGTRRNTDFSWVHGSRACGSWAHGRSFWALALCAGIFVALVALPYEAIGQVPPAADTAGAWSPPLFDAFDLFDVDAEQSGEEVADLVARPIDLNRASAGTLAGLPEVSTLLARRIVEHRRTQGPFAGPGDLLTVSGMTERRVTLIRPYVTFSAVPVSPSTEQHDRTRTAVSRPVAVRVSQRWERRLDLGRGYQRDTTASHYAGGPGRWVTRIDVRGGTRWRAASALDKDAGERWAWSPRQRAVGFDHVSGTLALHDAGPVDLVVLGDYTVRFGQGVGIWRGLAFGKGADVAAPIRSGAGVRPFASTEENRFFRGAAVRMRVPGGATAAAFASRRRLDASLDTDTFGEPVVTSLRESGLHRTPSEIDGRDAVRETAVGGALEVERGVVEAGLAAAHTALDVPRAASDRPDEAFDATGRRSSTVTTYATAYLGPGVVAAEVAWASGGWASSGGLAYDDGGRVEAALHLRHYAPQFDAPYAGGFGEGSGHNEDGLYLGLRMQVASDWVVSGYADHYRFPWLRYGLPRPSNGRDYRLRVEHRPFPWLSQYVQFRSETKEVALRQSAPNATRPHVGDARSSPLLVDALESHGRHSVRWHGQFLFSESLELRTRVEVARSRRSVSAQDAAYGFLMYQGWTWRPVRTLQIGGRVAVFDTDDYDSRVFAYEHGLRYAFRVPAFQGRGTRSYLLVRYRPSTRLTVEARYAVTRYDDRSTVGSGLDEVDGSRLREAGVQVLWAW